MSEKADAVPQDGGEADLVDLTDGADRIVRVARSRSAAADRAAIQRLVDAGAVRILITDDPTVSSVELKARLAEVGLTLEVDRRASVLLVGPQHPSAPRTDVWARNAALVDEHGV